MAGESDRETGDQDIVTDGQQQRATAIFLDYPFDGQCTASSSSSSFANPRLAAARQQGSRAEVAGKPERGLLRCGKRESN